MTRREGFRHVEATAWPRAPIRRALGDRANDPGVGSPPTRTTGATAPAGRSRAAGVGLRSAVRAREARAWIVEYARQRGWVVYRDTDKTGTTLVLLWPGEYPQVLHVNVVPDEANGSHDGE